MKTIDLHLHSTFSDGTLTPTEIVSLAKKKNLSAMSLTDHDTVNGIQEAIAAGLEHNIEIIPGIELSSCYGKKEIHILGLFIDHEDATLKNELVRICNVRDERNLKMINQFQEAGIMITMDEMLEFYGNAVLTRAHFADILLAKGYVKSRNEAFERYIGDHGPFFVPRERLLPEDAIRLIKQANGIPILAHPILYRLSNSELNKLVAYLCGLGLEGIEAIYSTYTASETRQVKALAKHYGLAISGGSDYHGANKPYLDLGTGKGNLRVPYEVLTNLKTLIKK